MGKELVFEKRGELCCTPDSVQYVNTNKQLIDRASKLRTRTSVFTVQQGNATETPLASIPRDLLTSHRSPLRLNPMVS